MANGSFKVWLVTENGYEHTKPLRAFTLRRKAEAFRNQKDLEHRKAPDDMVGGIRFKENLWFRVQQIDLVTHDGAHALHEALYKAVGKNG